MKYLASLFAIVTGFVLSAPAFCAQDELHDPTRPLINVTASAMVSAENASPENLQMLLIGRQRSYALIDGVVVKPGDMLNQWELVSIGSQSVVMRNASLTEEISLNPSVVKTLRSPKRSDASMDALDNPPSRKIP